MTLDLENLLYTEHKSQDIENNTDPENNLLSNISISCRYYTEHQYNTMIRGEKKISVIHFSARSLYSNFQTIQEYLRQLNNPFNIIAISETWINNKKGADFELEGYEFNYINRKNKNGGGVVIYVDNSFKYKLIATVDDSLECISVGICCEKMKNIMVSCKY